MKGPPFLSVAHTEYMACKMAAIMTSAAVAVSRAFVAFARAISIATCNGLAVLVMAVDALVLAEIAMAVVVFMMFSSVTPVHQSEPRVDTLMEFAVALAYVLIISAIVLVAAGGNGVDSARPKKTDAVRRRSVSDVDAAVVGANSDNRVKNTYRNGWRRNADSGVR